MILRLAIVWTVTFACVALSTMELRGENIVVVVLDDSGSMNEDMRAGRNSQPRMTVAKRALRKLVSQLPEETQLGILLMNGSSDSDGWLIPLAKLNRRLAIQQIEQVSADGGTPLGGSMKTAIDALLEQRRKQPIGDYRLLVVTDGEATDSDVLQRVLPDIVARGIYIDVIGVDMQTDHSLAIRSHSYRRADDEQSLERALNEVFAESSYVDDQDAAQSDFDMISALPDELAQQALTALEELQDKPIGTSGNDPDWENTGGSSNSTQTTSTTQRTGSWICSLAFLILLLIAVRSVVNLIGRATKK